MICVHYSFAYASLPFRRLAGLWEALAAQKRGATGTVPIIVLRYSAGTRKCIIVTRALYEVNKPSIIVPSSRYL